MAQSQPIKHFTLSDTGASMKVLQAVEGANVHVPGEAWLLKADFAPQGGDLLLTGPDGTQVLIRDFYNLETPPNLLTDGGAMITGDLAIKLAGPAAPGQLAFAGDQLAQAEEPIGRVEATDGVVEAIRVDGTKVTLAKGDEIFQGDTLVTAKGAAIGVTFVDDTTFSLGEEGRMVIDEMVYDAGTQEGQFSASLVQGVFSFVSGKIAKTSPDGMTVTTPVATIGIRGTKVAGRAAQEGAENTVSLLPELDSQGNPFVGELAVSNQSGGPPVILSAIGATVQMSSAFAPPPPPVVFSPQQIQQNFGGALTTLSTAAAARANAQAEENAQAADQAAAAAEAADAEAEAAAAEAEAAAAEAEAAAQEAEASGDPEAIAAAEAAQAEAEAKAAEAEAKAVEAEAAQAEADQAQANAEQAQAQAQVANTELQAQTQAFAQFGGPAPGNAPPGGDAPPSDGGPQAGTGGNGGDTGFIGNGGDIYGGGDTGLIGGTVVDLLGVVDPSGDNILFTGDGGDTWVFPQYVSPNALINDTPETPPPPPPPADDNIVVATGGSSSGATPSVTMQNVAVHSGQSLTFTSAGTFDSLVTNSFQGGAADTADVDNDGDLDIIIHGYDSVVGSGTSSTFVGLNDGSGNFTYGTAIASSLFTRAMDIADVNGDGNVDIVFAHSTAAAQPVYAGDGAGGFTLLTQTNTIYTTGGTIGGNNVALADFNGDGKQDMFVNVDAGVRIFLNAQNGDPEGQFTDTGQSLTSTKTAQSYRGIATGDIDGDGDIDVVTGSWGENMDIWVNDGSGNFSNTGVLGTGRLDASDGGTTGATNGVAMGDVDGDGDVDIVGFNRYIGNKVYLNDGSGTFTENQIFGNLNGSGGAGQLVDVDGDGDLDAVDASYAGIEISTNDGSGTFTTQSLGFSTTATDQAHVGDLDGDGVTDILVTRYGTGSTILTNDLPVINAKVVHNNTFTFEEVTFGVTDADNPAASSLIYTVSSIPANGSIKLNGSALSANGTFTQADVIAGNVTYLHDGTATTTDSFQFTVSDGTATTATQTFNMEVTADEFTGGYGKDSVTLTAAQGSGTVDLAEGADSLTLANGTNNLSVSNTETVTGGTGADTLTATGATAQTLTGGTGADTFTLTGASAVQTVRYTTTSDGATTGGSLTGRDVIYGYTQGTDKIGIAGTLAAAIDDIGTPDSALTWATNSAVDFTTSHESLVLNDATTSNFASFMTQSGAPTIIANLMNSLGVISATGDDGLVVYTANHATSGYGGGVFLFQENGTTANNVTADELTYLSQIDSTALSSTITSDVTIVS